MTLKEAVDFTKPKKSEKTNSTKSHRTVASVLLERWAKDTEAMAKGTIARYYDDAYGRFDLPDGYSSCDPDAALEYYIAYLNSAAEVKA